MNKTRFKLIRLILGSVLLIFGMMFHINIVSATSVTRGITTEVSAKITKKIENKTKSVIVNELNYIKEITTYYHKTLNIEIDDMEKITIGTPFLIYSLSDSNQSEIYYYPVININNNQIIVTIEVLKNALADEWTYNIGTEYVDSLNKINYKDGQYIFYDYNGEVYYDNGIQSLTFSNKKTSAKIVENFKQLDYSRKIETISNRISSFSTKENIKLPSQKITNFRMGYTPTMTGTTCQLYNPVGQGNYNLCWAASVATIVNYRQGTNFSAKNVADAEGIGYNAGGTLENAKNCLHRYGLTDYSIVYNTLNWNQVNENILKRQKPFYMSLFYDFNAMGHAVICLGCNESAVYQFICIWNPGENNGNGSAKIIKYYPAATTLSYAGKNWVWYYTISSYNQQINNEETIHL